MNQEPLQNAEEPPERKFVKDNNYYQVLGNGIRGIHQFFTSLDERVLLSGALQMVIESPERNGELKYLDKLGDTDRGRYLATQSALVRRFTLGIGQNYPSLDEQIRQLLQEDFQRFFAFYWMSKDNKAVPHEREGRLGNERTDCLGC